MSETLHLFWGKANPADGAVSPFHPLVAHALDVAAVATLLRHHHLGLDERLIGWLVALHDIGKFSRPFQGKVPALWPQAALGAFDANHPPPNGPKHDELTLYLLRERMGDRLDPVFPLGSRDWTHGERMSLFRALAGHHGRPVETKTEEISRAVIDTGCDGAAQAFVAAMNEVFQPPPCPLPDSSHALARVEWSLAGLTTLADWVGSRQAWFPYVGVEAVADPSAYFLQHAMPQAAVAVAAAGLSVAPPAPFGGVRRLFPGISLPSPAQAWAEGVALPEGPVLVVIEDLTGSGKTEAAITLAHRLLASGRADGVFLALPTMATANAMFDRMAEAYRGLFSAEARPSLALSHGRAHLDPRFAPAFAGEADVLGAEADPADQPAESHCAAWLAEDRRRALMAQVGVGTIDQALMAILPVRHATLRLQGLKSKVLVVDEAHAFDPYMERELEALLHFHAALGGSAILLSATLPQATRQKLVNAFRKGLGARSVTLSARDYPLASLVSSQGIIEEPCAVRENLARSVMVTRLPDADSALERIKCAVETGAAVAWIRNTVDDALAAATMLRAQGLTPLVFHARFALSDRLQIEAEVLRRFGRESAGEARRCVLVATQVIEQSLDLDFDLLCSDLAPVDSLIQRAGRLWRHQREGRPMAGPEMLVISPEPVDVPEAGWINDVLPGTAAVYRDPALLWRSARAIFGRDVLATPGDMRRLIEEVADADAPGAVPPAVAPAAQRAGGKATAAAGIARQNVLKFLDGYKRSAGAWEPDTHTPTRLEDRPSVTLRLALIREGRVVPYAQGTGDVRRDWSFSEVSVAKFRFASSPIAPEWAGAVEVAKRDWGRWERESERFVLVLLEPTDEAERFVLQGQAENGSVSRALYSAKEGLVWEDKEVGIPQEMKFPIDNQP